MRSLQEFQNTLLPIDDFRKGKTKFSDSFYHQYKALEKVGVITIQEDHCVQAYTSPSETIRETIPFVPRGTCKRESVGTIIVQKTPKGEELAQKGGLPQQEGSLVIRTGVYWVDKIVKNVARSKGEDDYRLIMVTYNAQWTPEYKQAMAILGDSLSEDRKSMQLFKFDPFKSKWIWITGDVANLNEEFKTNNVSKKLSE
jgi:hypothetical protein